MSLAHEVRITCDAAIGCDAHTGPAFTVTAARNAALGAGWSVYRVATTVDERITQVRDTWRCPEHRVAP